MKGIEAVVDDLTSQQIEDGPKKDLWWKEEVKLEIERLQLILRDPAFTQEEKTLTRSRIASYQEMIAMTVPTSTDWLLQLNQLAD